eukprot:m.196418 g.196418  ORF g.196418 m.196418 type:complete len:493 (+) comp19801_c0_seq1:69-1547(+)
MAPPSHEAEAHHPSSPDHAVAAADSDSALPRPAASPTASSTTPPITVTAQPPGLTREVVRDLLQSPVTISAADALIACGKGLRDGAGDTFAAAVSALEKEIGESEARTMLRLVFLVAGQTDVFDQVVDKAVQSREIKTEENLQKNDQMPNHIKQQLRDKVSALEAKLRGAVSKVCALALETFPPSVVDILRAFFVPVLTPSGLQDVFKDLDAQQSADRTDTRGRDFEARVAAWTRQQYPMCTVVPNAQMGSESQRGTKGEVDALVLTPHHAPGTSTDNRTEPSPPPCAPDASSAPVTASSPTTTTHAAPAADRGEPNVSSLPTLTAIVEAKVSTLHLPEDLSKCKNLWEALCAAPTATYRTSTMIKSDASIEFATHHGPMRVHVCVEEADGTTLKDLFARPLRMYAKTCAIKQLQDATKAAVQRQDIASTILHTGRHPADDSATETHAISTCLPDGEALEMLVEDWTKRLGDVNRLVTSRQLIYHVFHANVN